jgi:hypothetical protein
VGIAAVRCGLIHGGCRVKSPAMPQAGVKFYLFNFTDLCPGPPAVFTRP